MVERAMDVTQEVTQGVKCTVGDKTLDFHTKLKEGLTPIFSTSFGSVTIT